MSSQSIITRNILIPECYTRVLLTVDVVYLHQYFEWIVDRSIAFNQYYSDRLKPLILYGYRWYAITHAVNIIKIHIKGAGDK